MTVDSSNVNIRYVPATEWNILSVAVKKILLYPGVQMNDSLQTHSDL